MSDNTSPNADVERKYPLCCNPNEVATIITCLGELKNIIACVLDCTDDHSSGIKERIILCKLLDEIRQIEAKLDNPMFGLKEIKNEIIEINDVVSNSVFGLREVKNEIIDINNLLTNEFFGLNEIKSEIIDINDLLNNATFGIPELKNEIRIIENRTGRTIRLLTNEAFGLNEIKNEVRVIENQVRVLNRPLTCSTDSVLVCGTGVDGVIRTIKTDVNNVTTTLPSASTHSQIGQLFSVTFDAEFTFQETNRFNVLFQNPAGNARTMYLDKVITGFQVEPLNQPLSYEGNLNTSISRNATFSAAGAPQTPGNLNAASDNVSSILVSTSPAITNFGVRLINASQLNELSSLDLDGRIVVPPNSNIVISFLGQLAVSAMDADITVTWYEL